MFSRILYGNLYNFVLTQGNIEMFVNGEFVSSMPARVSLERDIGFMMMSYAE
jgi:hypothetical protein